MLTGLRLAALGYGNPAAGRELLLAVADFFRQVETQGKSGDNGE
ncbi:hypothetical protein CFU_3391 [Collimonas fungivorans Ter331]|uniref:Uncharacterized protein n=1 Tax=Collimonas fungivorans (strain Ter331) TaxID=1005048 RepID=G0AD31_COLFT|nr:hypothetical protein CFU_3391 [Collimonas fungivorans Ter331]